MKLQFSDYEKNDYRLTGIGSSILSPIAFCIGSRNVVGGHACRFSAFDRAARKLTLSEGEIGKFAAGMRLYLWSTAYDENSPYEIKIIAVDANAITLENDLAVTDEHVTRLAEWVGAVRDVNREAAAFAAGDLCFAVGDYATATGTLTLATGFAATAAGALSEARGD